MIAFSACSFALCVGAVSSDSPSAAPVISAAHVASKSAARHDLKFHSNGRFKILQFSDIHNGNAPDARSFAAMGKLIDSERPDLVILTGDSISSSDCANAKEMREAIRVLAAPMEERKTPWVMVFGNHDTDELKSFGVNKAQVYAIYRAYPHNINPPTAPDTYGTGNALLRITGSRSNKPVFGVWLVDSGAYAPDVLKGQKLGGYDWIHASQIVWYFETSRREERALGHKLPGLMFFHICLPEFAQMAASGKYVGERNEGECPSSVNSGLFAALLERGDVLGVYVGHDHANTYDGSYYGIRLGYDGSIGYGAYGVKSDIDAVRNRLRGGRVFVLDERNPRRYEAHFALAGEIAR